jgi:proteasome lid subunit RPN8/RPN11
MMGGAGVGVGAIKHGADYVRDPSGIGRAFAADVENTHFDPSGVDAAAVQAMDPNGKLHVPAGQPVQPMSTGAKPSAPVAQPSATGDIPASDLLGQVEPETAENAGAPAESAVSPETTQLWQSLMNGGTTDLNGKPSAVMQAGSVLMKAGAINGIDDFNALATKIGTINGLGLPEEARQAAIKGVVKQKLQEAGNGATRSPATEVAQESRGGADHPAAPGLRNDVDSAAGLRGRAAGASDAGAGEDRSAGSSASRGGDVAQPVTPAATIKAVTPDHSIRASSDIAGIVLNLQHGFKQSLDEFEHTSKSPTLNKVKDHFRKQFNQLLSSGDLDKLENHFFEDGQLASGDLMGNEWVEQAVNKLAQIYQDQAGGPKQEAKPSIVTEVKQAKGRSEAQKKNDAKLAARRKLNTDTDSISMAVRKLGGINKSADLAGEIRDLRFGPSFMGHVWKANGKGIGMDQMALLLAGHGYVDESAVDGGVGEMLEKLREDLFGSPQMSTHQSGDAMQSAYEAHMQDREEQAALAQDGLGALSDEEISDVAEAIDTFDELAGIDLIDHAGPKKSYNNVEEELDDIFGPSAQSAETQPAQGPAANDVASRQGSGAEDHPAQAGPADEFSLESQTEASRRANETRIAEAAAAEESAKRKDDAEAKRISDQKEIDARMGDSVDHFQLGQSAEDALAGQGDIFGQPAAKKPSIVEDAKKAKAEAQQPKKGVEGQLFASGEVVLTATGRKTTPFPKINLGTNRKAGNSVKAVDKWLIDNAIAEAEARGDDFNLTQFKGVNPAKPSQADKDSAEMYLFGDQQPPVLKPFTKPLVQPSLAADAKKAKEAAEKQKALDDLDAGLADLADILGKNARASLTPEQNQKLLPVLTRVMDAAFRLGYIKFKDASRFVLKTIREKVGKEVADQISLDHLQGAYISMAGDKEGASSKREVIDVESLDEIEPQEAAPNEMADFAAQAREEQKQWDAANERATKIGNKAALDAQAKFEDGDIDLPEFTQLLDAAEAEAKTSFERLYGTPEEQKAALADMPIGTFYWIDDGALSKEVSFKVREQQTDQVIGQRFQNGKGDRNKVGTITKVYKRDGVIYSPSLKWGGGHNEPSRIVLLDSQEKPSLANDLAKAKKPVTPQVPTGASETPSLNDDLKKYKDLNDRNKALDEKIDALQDIQVRELYKEMNLAGANRAVDTLRETLKEEHPDDLDAGFAKLAANIVAKYPGIEGTEFQIRKNSAGYSVEILDTDANVYLPTLRRYTGDDALQQATEYAESIAKKSDPDVAPEDVQDVVRVTPGREADAPKSFDSDAWNKSRDETINSSKNSGNVHLDQVPVYVETMRGKEIYYAHDKKEKGVIRTVDNRGSVMVHWSDKYSADKELATEKKDGKKTVFESWLAPTDLKDYVFANPQELRQYAKAGQPASTAQESKIDAAAHEAATSPRNDLPEPTQAQKESGNYRKGHVSIAGMDIAIENPAGSERSGTDANGKTWKVELKHHYGYIKGTVGNDKDHIDIFIKPGTAQDYAGPVYVIDQKKGNGHFDEHKVVLGADGREAALEIYRSNYEPGWDGVRSVRKFTLDGFKGWLASGETTKPAAEYKDAAETQIQSSEGKPINIGDHAWLENPYTGTQQKRESVFNPETGKYNYKYVNVPRTGSTLSPGYTVVGIKGNSVEVLGSEWVTDAGDGKPGWKKKLEWVAVKRIRKNTPQSAKEIKEALDAASTLRNSQPDRQDAGSENSLGEQPVLDEPAGAEPDGSGAVRGAGEERDGQDGGESLPAGRAAAGGESGDQPLHRGNGAAGNEVGAAGDLFGFGSDLFGEQGVPDDEGAADAVEAVARTTQTLAGKIAAQKAADSHPVVYGYRASIDATLPFLSEGQREDVHFAEKRLGKEDGYGVLFTNGTGTGKTYLGLGIAKRMVRQGKTNGLIVVPNDKMVEDWTDSGKNLGLDVVALEGLEDHGKGIAVTTYANFGMNRTLADREYDWIITDESHNLMQNAQATETEALATLRAISLHPDGAYRRASMQNRDLVDEIERLTAAQKSTKAHPDMRDEEYNAIRQREKEIGEQLKELHAKWQEVRNQVKADVLARQGAARPRVVMLSATPFAYEKNVQLAEGYLFEFEKRKDNAAYNEPSGYEKFMVEHFGYRMRYNKLTQPDAKVNSGLMQRQFNTWMRKQGSLSARILDVDFDYDRKFTLIASGIGHKIDDGLQWLREQGGGRFMPLYTAASNKFDYLSRMRLLEAIKAEAAVDYIKQHHAMGRKAVVFHDYNDGGGFNPFEFHESHENPEQRVRISLEGGGYTEELIKWNDLVREFNAQRPDLAKMDTAKYKSPIATLTQHFENALLFNGRVPKNERRMNIKRFNDDANQNANLLIVQSAANAGWSGHDTTGLNKRLVLNLGLPTAPTKAIQQEGRVYRTGQASDAIFRYMNTGTSWERIAFATTIARRASAAENMAMGEQARGLLDSFINAFEDSAEYPASAEDGKGGKAIDRALASILSEFDRAKSYYYGQLKKTSKNKSAEGKDYFATPEPVGYKMVEWLDAQNDDHFLEPSAGHGAIARWFPDQHARTIVEPSMELASRAALVTDAKLVNERFEDLSIVNKYDAIAMNPPFGLGGKTAIEHLDKAFRHLNDGGRIVALIPTGPAADKRFDEWMYGKKSVPVKPLLKIEGLGDVYKGDTLNTNAAWAKVGVVSKVTRDNGRDQIWLKLPDGNGETLVSEASIAAIKPTGPRTHEVDNAPHAYLRASILLPGSTFNRAGTGVMTRIVIIDRVLDKDQAAKLQGGYVRDLSGVADIDELFDSIEHMEIAPRIQKERPAPVGEVVKAAKADRVARAAEARQREAEAVASGKVAAAGDSHITFEVKDGKLVTNAPTVKVMTKKDKELTGVIVPDKETAMSVDKYTYRPQGHAGYLVRLEHIVRPGVDGEVKTLHNANKDNSFDVIGGENGQPGLRDTGRDGREENEAPGEVHRPRIIGNAVTKPESGKPVSIIGATARTADDLAALAQVYRDPRYETMRFFFTKMGEIVGHTAVSSRLPGETAAFPVSNKEAIAWMQSQMDAVDADGYYLLHNHPSGDPTPSDADLSVTNWIKSRVDGFMGHVVINSNKYAVLSDDAQEGLKQQIIHKDFGSDKLLKPSINNPVLGKQISDYADIATIGKSLQKEGWATIIGVDASNHQVRGIMEIPEAMLWSEKRTLAALRNFARQTGSDALFAAEASAKHESRYQDLIRANALFGVVTKEGKKLSNTDIDKTLSFGVNKRGGAVVKNNTINAAVRRMQWKDSAIIDGLPIFKGDGFSLMATTEIPHETDFETHPLALHWGHVSQIPEWSKPYHFTIRGENGDGILGDMSADVDRAGNIVAIHDFNILGKRAGLGAKIIAGIAANAPGQLKIVEAIPQSQGFWRKVGLNELDDQKTGYIRAADAARYIVGKERSPAQGLDEGLDGVPADASSKGVSGTGIEVEEVNPDDLPDGMDFLRVHSPARQFHLDGEPSPLAAELRRAKKKRMEDDTSVVDHLLGGKFLFQAAGKLSDVTGLTRLASSTYDGVLEKTGEILPQGVKNLGETIKAGIVSDYGLDESYIDRKADMKAAEAAQARKNAGLVEMLAGLTRAESRVAYNWMQEKPDTAIEQQLMKSLPEASLKTLQQLKQLISDLSKEAVKLGQLSPEAFERNNMAYLHRTYAKHVLSNEGWLGQQLRARATRIKGNQYKGRGIFEHVGMDQIVAPDFWKRKTQDGKADKSLKGEKLIRLERRDASAEMMDPLPGMTAKPLGKLREVIYLPANEPIPVRFGSWVHAGEWEVRDTQGDKLVVWRDLTKAERERLGELDEVRYAVATTLQIAVHDIEVGKFFEWTAKQYAKAEPEGREVAASHSLRTAYGKDEWVQVPASNIPDTKVKRYGALAGLYVPGPVWNDIRQMASQQQGEFAKTYQAVLAFWKKSKTAWSPGVHMNNVMANFVMADWHDIRAADLAEALAVWAKKGKPGYKELFERFEDSGAMGGMFASNELMRDEIQARLAELKTELMGEQDIEAETGKMAKVLHLLALATVKPAKFYTEKMGAAYQNEDAFFRLAVFLKAVRYGKTDREAGSLARHAFLNYDINAPWVQAARKSVLPFISFFYRALPMAVQTVKTKPWKVAKLMVFWSLVNALGASFGGDDDEEEKRHRKLMADEKSGRVWGLVPKMIRMPWNSERGAPIYLDIRRWVPVGDLVDMDMGAGMLPPWATPGGPAMILAELAMMNKSMFTKRDLLQDTDTASEKAIKSVDHLFKGFMPNVPVPNPLGWALPTQAGQLQTYSWAGIEKAYTRKENEFGEVRSVPQAVANAVGIKVGSYPEEGLKAAAIFDAKKQINEITKNMQRADREYGSLLRPGLEDVKRRDRTMIEQMAKRKEVERKLGEKIR